MPWVHLVVALALLEFLYFGFEVGRARARFNVPAPATSGHEIFERYFRVQMNTLEQLVVFLPAIVIFGHYLSPYIAAALGAVFIVGRLLYLRGYVRDPRKREAGFVLSALPNAILLLGALFGAARGVWYR
ncbi:MAG TPA: MAPEG family protein [Steroidobacteraceae bacterium]